MASDDKKIKTNPAPKNEAPPKKNNEAPPKKNNEAPPKNKSASGVDPSKAEVGEKTADISSSYSRGEGQKPVSKAYKENWNAIFAKKKKR
jgi:hypothetical protein